MDAVFGSFLIEYPVSSEFGTNKTVKARFWPWLEPCFRQTSFNAFVLFRREEAGKVIGKRELITRDWQTRAHNPWQTRAHNPRQTRAHNLTRQEAEEVFGDTALILAARRGHQEVVQVMSPEISGLLKTLGLFK